MDELIRASLKILRQKKPMEITIDVPQGLHHPSDLDVSFGLDEERA